MWRRISAMVVAVAALIALVAGYRATLTRVDIYDDGEHKTVFTHQTNVAMVLAETGTSLREEDILTPESNTLVEDGIKVHIERASPVVLSVDGQERILYTHERSAADILAQAGVILDQYDQTLTLAPKLYDPDGTLFRVQVKRATQIVLDSNGIQTSLYTTAATVGEAVIEAGTQLYRADLISPDPSTPIQNGLRIQIERSIPINVQVDGHTIRTRTHRTQVNEVLADVGVTLNGQDYTDPVLDATLGEDMIIEVIRVAETVIVEQSPIPFDTVWQADPDSEIDTQSLLQEGEPGVLERRTRLHYENGQLVERRIEGESVVLAPLNRVMGFGTKIIIRTLQTPSGPVDYWRVYRVLATSYSASTAGTSPDAPWYGYTRLGIPMKKGIVAVDPRYIDLGSYVYVPGYGIGHAADTGGVIQGRRIDLGYDDDNLELWYTWVDVYLLTPVPDDVNYLGP